MFIVPKNGSANHVYYLRNWIGKSKKLRHIHDSGVKIMYTEADSDF